MHTSMLLPVLASSVASVGPKWDTSAIDYTQKAAKAVIYPSLPEPLADASVERIEKLPHDAARRFVTDFEIFTGSCRARSFRDLSRAHVLTALERIDVAGLLNQDPDDQFNLLMSGVYQYWDQQIIKNS